MRRRRRLGAGVGVAVAIGLSVAAGTSRSGSGAPRISSSVFRPPARAALSWFAALDRKDERAALRHFTPGARYQMDWSGGPSEWSEFTHVRCRQLSATRSTAQVKCTFHESASPSEGSPVSFWSVSLRRAASGRWLITDYGQP